MLFFFCVCVFSDFLYKSICCGSIWIASTTTYAFIRKEVDIKYTGCNLKSAELLDCALIGVCAVIRSNTVFQISYHSCAILKMLVQTWTPLPRHSVSYKIAYAPNKDSDQPARPYSLIWVFPRYTVGSNAPKCLQVHSDNSDPIAQMCRLIRVFTGLTCSLVGNVVPWLK